MSARIAGTVREWLRRGGPLATLPLRGRRTGITWVERAAEARALAAMSHGELLDAFAEATGGALGDAEIESGPSVYPLAPSMRAAMWRRASPWSGTPRTVCIRSTPRASTWALPTWAPWSTPWWQAKSRGLDLGSGEALLPYARARRGENTQRLWLTDGLVRLFTADLPPLRAARSLALDTIERLPPLKRLAVRHGMQAR